MRNQGLINAVKRAVAGSLAAILVVSGLTLVPEATETAAGSTVFYEEVDDTSAATKESGGDNDILKDGKVWSRPR